MTRCTSTRITGSLGTQLKTLVGSVERAQAHVRPPAQKSATLASGGLSDLFLVCTMGVKPAMFQSC